MPSPCVEVYPWIGWTQAHWTNDSGRTTEVFMSVCRHRFELDYVQSNISVSRKARRTVLLTYCQSSDTKACACTRCFCINLCCFFSDDRSYHLIHSIIQCGRIPRLKLPPKNAFSNLNREFLSRRRRELNEYLSVSHSTVPFIYTIRKSI